MALNIKDAETDRVARELAAATGETITVATRIAIEERLARVRRRGGAPDGSVRLAELVRRGRARRRDARRTDEEILGYGADGLPGSGAVAAR